MLGQRDKAHFEKVWQSKQQHGQFTTAYRLGDNQRVDKTLQIIRSGQRFLDVGCGTGILALQVKAKFLEVYGVDIAEIPVQVACQQGIQASLVNLNAEPLPYADDFFDSLTILAALQLMYDPEAVIQEAFRVLKPNGELLISLPNMRTVWRVYKLAVLGRFPRTSLDTVGCDGGTLHYFCYHDIVKLLRHAGFVPTASYGIFCLPKFLRHLPDNGFLGSLKRDFFSAEILVRAMKGVR